jgi:Flp pilus assembly protein protease CpaA
VRTIGWLLTGSIPGILLTSKLTLKVPDRVLRLGLASVLMLSGLKLIDFAGADWVIAGGALAAAIGISSWAFVTRLDRRPRAETAA